MLYLRFTIGDNRYSFPIDFIFDDVKGKYKRKLLSYPFDLDRLKKVFQMDVTPSDYDDSFDWDSWNWTISFDVTLDDDEDTSDDEEDTSDDEVDTSDDEDIINPRDLVNFSYEYDCFWEHRLPDGSLSYRTVDAIRYGEIVI